VLTTNVEIDENVSGTSIKPGSKNSNTLHSISKEIEELRIAKDIVNELGYIERILNVQLSVFEKWKPGKYKLDLVESNLSRDLLSKLKMKIEDLNKAAGTVEQRVSALRVRVLPKIDDHS